MSGAIVVEGMERYVPEVGTLRERILVLRGSSIEHDSSAAALRREVAIAGKAAAQRLDWRTEFLPSTEWFGPRLKSQPASVSSGAL
jgi:hypothetical protein